MSEDRRRYLLEIAGLNLESALRRRKAAELELDDARNAVEAARDYIKLIESTAALP